MRIIKEHDERRNEILDAAEHLFHTKGYKDCTVNDILHAVSIAKGTFYYYFKSKEEVLDAVVDRYNNIIVQRANNILTNQNLDCSQKLLSLFTAMNIKEEVSEELLKEMHKKENALLHQKTLNQAVTTLAPMMAEVIEEGMKEGLWTCKYPLRYMQIILASSITLTDEGIFEQSENSQFEIITAIISLVEQMLGVPEGVYMSSYMNMIGNHQ